MMRPPQLNHWGKRSAGGRRKEVGEDIDEGTTQQNEKSVKTPKKSRKVAKVLNQLETNEQDEETVGTFNTPRKAGRAKKVLADQEEKEGKGKGLEKEEDTGNAKNSLETMMTPKKGGRRRCEEINEEDFLEKHMKHIHDEFEELTGQLEVTNQPTEVEELEEPPVKMSGGDVAVEKKGRGKPKADKTEKAAKDEVETTEPKKRGRTAKTAAAEKVAAEKEDGPTPAKRGRGRPKSKTAPAKTKAKAGDTGKRGWPKKDKKKKKKKKKNNQLIEG